MSIGDLVVIRGKDLVLGTALVDRLESSQGEKEFRRCPACGLTKIKGRSTLTPRYRCECEEVFETPRITHEACTLFEAHFNHSFNRLAHDIPIESFWDVAVALNKQHSILQLDLAATVGLLDGGC